MKTILSIFGVAIIILAIANYRESTINPYQEGTHLDYEIHCENGFVYKMYQHTSIQVLNSDGTPLKCGHKIY